MLEIDFESDGFPAPGPVQNGPGRLSVSWDDLLWAAITVGRPNRYYVFRNGLPSIYESLFRVSAMRMLLEQTGPTARRVRRTNAAKSLDPSEKGAVNYFLGLTLSKLFADAMLGAPWLLHLDVFRSQLNPTLLSGRSRPDLVGRTTNGDWISLESKGRVSPPSADAKDKAKQQAMRLIAVNGTQIQFHVGAFAYFRQDTLKFFWRDPKPENIEPHNSIRLEFPEDDFWRHYYLPILAVVAPGRDASIARSDIPVPMENADLKIRVLPQVMELLRLEKWRAAAKWCLEHKMTLTREGVRGDGVQVIAGESWTKRFEESLE